mgnify:CR=1 FL=1
MVIESMEAFGKKDTEDNYLRVNKLLSLIHISEPTRP